jgi:hypothetical protein
MIVLCHHWKKYSITTKFTDMKKMFDLMYELMGYVRDGKIAENILEAFVSQFRDQVIQSVIPIPDDDFKCVFMSEPITIPNIETIVTDCKKLWGDKIGSAPVPEDLKTGVQKRIKIFCNKKPKSPQKIIHRLKQEPGAILSNVFGLRIAEITCRSQLRQNCRIYGIREGDNVVPSVCFDFDENDTTYEGLTWSDVFPGNNYFMVLCD